MAAKRPFADLGSDDDTKSPFDAHGSSLKRRKQNGRGKGNAKGNAKDSNISWTKKRARNIERLLQKDQELPANVRNEMERELAAHRGTIADKTLHKRRSKMISKYHMVRFFERKKAMRLIKQLRKKIEQSDSREEIEELKRSLHVAEVDEAYTLHYPHAEPYVSLYGSSKTDDDAGNAMEKPAAEASLKAKRPPMWDVIEETMKEGPAALSKLRERHVPEDGASKPQPRQRTQPTIVNKKAPAEGNSRGKAEHKANAPHQTNQPALNRRERRRLLHKAMPTPANNDEDDDDGGGFFEED